MMIPSNVSLRTTLDAVQKKIDGKDFAGALTVLNKLAKDESRRASLVDTSRMYFTMAWCLYELGHYKHSLLRVRAALKLARPTAAHDLYAREKQLCGIVLTRIGRNLDATEAYLEAFAGFKRSGQNQMLYGTLVNLGLCHFAQGDLGQSERNFTDAESYARKYNSPHEIGLCRRNIARVLVFSGLFDRASLILGSPMLSETSMIAAAQVSTILSQIDVFRLEFDRGSVSLQKSKMIFGTASSARDVAVCLEFLGLNEYFAGNYAKAREYYDQVLAMPEPTASAVAQTLRMLTDVEIAEGNWDAAKATAARADAAINKISERIELGALWRAYGQIHTHDNDYATAREYFEKSIDLLRQLGARYELALSHFDAGRSKAYSQEEQIEHLKAAKALFVDMEVPKRVAQVDEALGKIASLRTGNSDKTKRSLTLKSATAAPVVVAVSRSMTGIMELVDQIKNNDMTVLITGETGTGKDLLAEYIHSTGNRCGSSFKAINCAAMPESLLELELFGVKKGTFTGSTTDKPGLIESADGGTFYFDEIGDAPATIQSKLLRVIETKTVRRLGSNEDVRVNVRFIAATNHNLQERIASRDFRRDLYYRLAEVEITLPPLRDRREDVMPLISQFLKAEKVELTTEQYLQLDLRVNGYDWPGNVREVRRLVKLATATATNGELIPALESALDLLNDSGIPQTKAALIELLARNNGNIASASRELGIPRTTLVSHLKKFGLL